MYAAMLSLCVDDLAGAHGMLELHAIPPCRSHVLLLVLPLVGTSGQLGGKVDVAALAAHAWGDGDRAQMGQLGGPEAGFLP